MTIGHHWKHSIDFSECMTFLKGVDKKFLYIRAYEVKVFKLFLHLTGVFDSVQF